jgi:NitT/TauT family transport system permease protein
MIRHPITLWLFVGLGLLGFVVLGGVYAGLSVRQTRINPEQTILPGVKGISAGFQKILKPQGSESSPKPAMLWTDVSATYWRLFLGMLLGVSLSVVVGIAMGAYRWIEAILSPVISFMAKVPPTAMMPVYFVMVGTDQKMFASMVALGIFFSMAQSVYQAARKDVSDDAIDKAYTLGASDSEIIVDVIWNQILPRILDNVRLQIGPAMVFLLAAEMLVGGQGMGYRIRMESRILNLSVVYIYLFILGGSGLLLEWFLLWTRRRLCPWFGE